MKAVIGSIATCIAVVCAIPLLPAEIKIQIISYLSIPFIVLGGAVGFISAKIEGVLCGAIIGALFPVVLQLVGETLGTLIDFYT